MSFLGCRTVDMNQGQCCHNNDSKEKSFSARMGRGMMHVRIGMDMDVDRYGVDGVE